MGGKGSTRVEKEKLKRTESSARISIATELDKHQNCLPSVSSSYLAETMSARSRLRELEERTYGTK